MPTDPDPFPPPEPVPPPSARPSPGPPPLEEEIAAIHDAARAEEIEERQRLRAFWEMVSQLTPRTWVTPLIVGANVLVFAVMAAGGVHLLQPKPTDMIAWGANFGPLTLEGQWWRVLTATFLHWGVLHLGINMWVLWDAGRLVERLVGNVGFLVLYLASGIWGNFASLAWNPDVVSAGASGSVFGVWGVLGAFYVRKSAALPPEVVLGLKRSIGPFILYNLLFGFFVQGIDQAAHLGGLVGGFVLGCLLAQPIRPEAKAGRLQRNLFALITAAAVSGLAIAALPGTTGSAFLAIQRFAKVEEAALRQWQENIQQLHTGKLTEAEYVRRLREDILRPWRETAADLAAVRPRRPELQQQVANMLKYMRLRDEGWELSAQASERRDQALIIQAEEKHQEANRLAQQITGVKP